MNRVITMVTDRILADIENNNSLPWHRPWCSVSGAYNRITGKTYSLTNQLILRHSGEYATYRQWTSEGAHIKKGALCEYVIFWKWPEPTVGHGDVLGSEMDDGADACLDCSSDPGVDRADNLDYKKAPILRYYRVFHVSQTDMEPKQPEKIFHTQPIDVAEKLLREYVRREGIRLEIEPSNTAYYSVERDLVHIPRINQYSSGTEYYSTAFHELAHTTAHPRRLNRLTGKNMVFASSDYSKEELCAEITSAGILHSIGISTEESIRNSSAYVRGWMDALNKDKRMLIFASSQADKAMRYILG